VNSRQQLIGVVALQDLKAFLNGSRELESVIASDIMRPPPPCLTPSLRLTDALPLILQSELRNIPVVCDLDEKRLVGSLSRAKALALFSEAIAEKSKPAG
jgi:CBS domain-containing protein